MPNCPKCPLKVFKPCTSINRKNITNTQAYQHEQIYKENITEWERVRLLQNLVNQYPRGTISSTSHRNTVINVRMYDNLTWLTVLMSDEILMCARHGVTYIFFNWWVGVFVSCPYRVASCIRVCATQDGITQIWKLCTWYSFIVVLLFHFVALYIFILNW